MLTGKPKLCLLFILSCFSYVFQETILCGTNLLKSANKIAFRAMSSVFTLGTGGSWRKSAQKILCVPPSAISSSVQCIACQRVSWISHHCSGQWSSSIHLCLLSFTIKLDSEFLFRISVFPLPFHCLFLLLLIHFFCHGMPLFDSPDKPPISQDNFFVYPCSA